MDVTRRRFLALGGAAAAFGVGAAVGHRSDRGMTASPHAVKRDPFTLGVASGDPWPDSVVLWTRLVPRPEDPHVTGMGEQPYEVAWEVATDPAMSTITRRGASWALPTLAHSVHVVVDGLEPGRDYWYRFRLGPWISPIGRARTAPPAGTRLGVLTVVAASCQAWDAGYFTAHRHLAAEQPDAVLFLGDYVYERPVDAARCGRRLDARLPDHLTAEATTLDEYRARYAWYQRDPDLQAAHRAAPWIVTWDDHEVEDNYAGDLPGRESSSAAFLTRRAAAYQAYWEHLPLRVPPPVGSAMTIHRRLPFGSLADVHVLDTRQHRSDQIDGRAWQRPSAAHADPSRTVLGADQQRWLHHGLATSTATWNIVAQQVIAGRLDIEAAGEEVRNVDTWDGYPVAQRQLHQALATAANPVVLTGDLHAAYALDIRSPPGVQDPRAVAVEFATTSISSGGDGEDLSPTGQRLLAANPHLHFAHYRRGYLRCRLTPEQMTADVRAVPYVTGAPDAPVETVATFAVDAGSRAMRAA